MSNNNPFTGKRNYDSAWYKRAVNLRTQIINRCTDESHPLYKTYGARGVTVCDRWVESFENFLEDLPNIDGWDYEEWVNGRLQLDKDSKGFKHYSLETCEWLSPYDNNSLGNGSSFIAVNPLGDIVEHSNTTEFCRATGLSYNAVIKRSSGTTDNRLLLDGWFIPIQKRNTKKNRRNLSLPLHVKDVLTGIEVTVADLDEATKLLGVGKKAIRDAINPSKKAVLVANHYVVRDNTSDYKKGSYNQYRVTSNKGSRTYNTLKQVCEELNLNMTCVSECLHGKQKTHKGLSFELVVVRF